MLKRIQALLPRFTWAQRFALASLVILVAGMFGMGWWVGRQIESGVVHQTAANTALYVSSVVEPNLQELVYSDTITPEHQAMLANVLQDTSLGQHITAVKVWNSQGRIVYATDPENLGRVFPVAGGLARALRGWVAADISVLDQPENAFDRDRGARRLETYSPVRRAGTSEIIAAVEFYQTVDDLDRDIATAQQRSWLIVGVATLAMYALLAGFVRRTSDTISRQQTELTSQVHQLRELLGQNQELHERARRAARRTTALNERFLRRISAELHDGPAQDLGLALLRLDHLRPRAELAAAAGSNPAPAGPPDFHVVQRSLQHALQEIRAISAGMGLPELGNLTLSETVVRAVRSHEQRTGTRVALDLDGLPADATLPLKITVYRIVQEALNNAFRHAGGADQQIHMRYTSNLLSLIIADHGPGFCEPSAGEWDNHLGLAGMRERVESLGGIFRVESEVGKGTRVIAQLPLDSGQTENDR
jgi:signal transduction histidine kinase